MIVTSWNIRGLNSKGKQSYLKERIKKDKPSIMIIQETKISSQQLEWILKTQKIQYEIMGQDANGIARGLAILWNPEEVLFENWISSTRILTGLFIMTGSVERIIISGVYGPHIPRDWRNFLKDLQITRKIFLGVPWIVGGEFNMIRTTEDKK